MRIIHRSFSTQCELNKLEDAVKEYMQAIYRFRKAESEMSDDYNGSRCEMNRLEGVLQWTRHCIYTNSTHLLYEEQAEARQFARCPIPIWDKQINPPTTQYKKLIQGEYFDRLIVEENSSNKSQ